MRDLAGSEKPPGFGAALGGWERVLGTAHVMLNPELLQAANTATFPTRARVWAILKPANREQVQSCVRVANCYDIAIHPVSSGKNWGYGSRVPSCDGVLLDVSRLN